MSLGFACIRVWLFNTSHNAQNNKKKTAGKRNSMFTSTWIACLLILSRGFHDSVFNPQGFRTKTFLKAFWHLNENDNALQFKFRIAWSLTRPTLASCQIKQVQRWSAGTPFSGSSEPFFYCACRNLFSAKLAQLLKKIAALVVHTGWLCRLFRYVYTTGRALAILAEGTTFDTRLGCWRLLFCFTQKFHFTFFPFPFLCPFTSTVRLR